MHEMVEQDAKHLQNVPYSFKNGVTGFSFKVISYI